MTVYDKRRASDDPCRWKLMYIQDRIQNCADPAFQAAHRTQMLVSVSIIHSCHELNVPKKSSSQTMLAII
jgi:hypothetical protein